MQVLYRLKDLDEGTYWNTGKGFTKTGTLYLTAKMAQKRLNTKTSMSDIFKGRNVKVVRVTLDEGARWKDRQYIE